jgi:hypothetical protein
VLRSLGHGQKAYDGLVTLALLAGMGWILAVAIIPSLASRRLTDCLSFVSSTSCSIVISEVVSMYSFPQIHYFCDLRYLPHSLVSGLMQGSIDSIGNWALGADQWR